MILSGFFLVTPTCPPPTISLSSYPTAPHWHNATLSTFPVLMHKLHQILFDRKTWHVGSAGLNWHGRIHWNEKLGCLGLHTGNLPLFCTKGVDISLWGSHSHLLCHVWLQLGSLGWALSDISSFICSTRSPSQEKRTITQICNVGGGNNSNNKALEISNEIHFLSRQVFFVVHIPL